MIDGKKYQNCTKLTKKQQEKRDRDNEAMAKDKDWTWATRMPKMQEFMDKQEAYLKENPQPEPEKSVLRNLTDEEMVVWKKEREESEARMQVWEAKRKIEMAEEARVKAEKAALEPKPVLTRVEKFQAELKLKREEEERFAAENEAMFAEPEI